MKTKELIKKLNQIDGVHAETTDPGKILVYSYSNSFVLSTWENAHIWLEVHIKPANSLIWPYKTRAMVAALIDEYLDTPVNERGEEKKYTVQVIKGNGHSYLNQGTDDVLFLADRSEDDDYHTRFTQAEIDMFKQRDDLAIDWDKAIVKEVHDDE